ncbi:cytochrome c oxidase assembly protein [Microbacterium sp. 22242]|uniref:cytochrome c oxidase assembly protein n=1 Tax=Microbacterium sp. 22242 TaxID=3453896 RepID=UPI003F86E79A
MGIFLSPMPPGTAPMTGPMWMPSLPLTVPRLFAIHPQPIPVLPIAGLGLLVLYVVGVTVLRRRGDAWPVMRTTSWVAGVLSMLLMTATGFDGYGMELFGVHMIQHMTLSMVTPIFLALGAPATLLLRALSAGGIRRRKIRALLLRVLHSRLAAVIANPIVIGLLFLFSLYGLYFTPVFDALMGTMWGHNLMLVHFLLIGMLYFWGVLGVDPSPRRGNTLMGRAGSPVARIAEMAIPVPFHAFFGVVLMMASTVVVSFYSAPRRSLGVTAIGDQQTAGGIAWGFTELPTLLVLFVLFVQWQRSDARQAAAAERRAERDGDAELTAYNLRLQDLTRQDRGQR